MRSLAEDRLLELRAALDQLSIHADALTPMGPDEILALARRGDITVLDVRPETEFAAGHLPYAQSMPLADLQRRLKELPCDKPIVAYCRGPFCLMAKDAVAYLHAAGIAATRTDLGVAEWRALGHTLETPTP
jgi:rhodanese-related sulfurtransferase